MRGDVLRAVAGPSRRVGNYQTQTVGEHPRMGTIEGITIGLPSLLLLYLPLKRSCHSPAPLLVLKFSFTCRFFFRSSMSTFCF